jgi:hypothetical protein
MLLATLLSVLAAVLHVIWNMVVKGGEDRLVAQWAVTTVGAVFVARFLVVLGPPEAGGCSLHSGVGCDPRVLQPRTFASV